MSPVSIQSPEGTHSSPRDAHLSPGGAIRVPGAPIQVPGAPIQVLGAPIQVPKGSHSGPNGAHSSPRGAHSGPKSTHSSPRGAHSGPKGSHSGPNGANSGSNGAHSRWCPFRSQGCLPKALIAISSSRRDDSRPQGDLSSPRESFQVQRCSLWPQMPPFLAPPHLQKLVRWDRCMQTRFTENEGLGPGMDSITSLIQVLWRRSICREPTRSSSIVNTKDSGEARLSVAESLAQTFAPMAVSPIELT